LSYPLFSTRVSSAHAIVETNHLSFVGPKYATNSTLMHVQGWIRTQDLS